MRGSGRNAGKGEHRVAVVTGGSAGIGRATVREFAARGYDVAVLARGQDGLAAAVGEVEQAGRRGLAVPTDVADADAVDAAAKTVEAELGPIDVWVNDAFTGSIAFFDELTAEEYRRITEVTYLGFVNGTRAALRHMAPRGRGVIIQVGSALAFRGIPLQAAYCGAKHAIVGFTESVRTELLHKKSPVQLCEVHLPGINTPQFEQVIHAASPTTRAPSLLSTSRRSPPGLSPTWPNARGARCGSARPRWPPSSPTASPPR